MLIKETTRLKLPFKNMIRYEKYSHAPNYTFSAALKNGRHKFKKKKRRWKRQQYLHKAYRKIFCDDEKIHPLRQKIQSCTPIIHHHHPVGGNSNPPPVVVAYFVNKPHDKEDFQRRTWRRAAFLVNDEMDQLYGNE